MERLPTAPAEKRFLVPLPAGHGLEGKVPEYLVARLDRMFSARHLMLLDTAFGKFLRSGPTAGGAKLKRESRSTRSVYFHVGWWKKCAKRIFLSADSRRQKPEAKAHLYRVLRILKRHFIPKMVRALRPLVPTHFETTDR